jgi:hypothetical protein
MRMLFGKNGVTPLRIRLRLSQHVRTLTTGSTKLSQKPSESLDDCFARFESIMSSLRSCGLLGYDDNEHAKQLLYALDDHIWGMKITALEESADFVTLTTEKLFSKFKSHKLSRKGHLNHDVSFTSKALINSAHVGVMMLTPPMLSHLLWSLSCLLWL